MTYIYTEMCLNVYSQEITPAGNMHSLAHTQMCACACGHRHTHTLTGGQADTHYQVDKNKGIQAHIHTYTLTQ